MFYNHLNAIIRGVWLEALMNITEKSSSRLRLNQLTTALGKWRIAFLFFALAYAIILLLNLLNMPITWDEVVHFNGGLYLNWGLYDKFVNNAFYPPLYDIITLLFFRTFGISVLSARLVPVVFSTLSLWAVFELAYRMYDGKIALLSAVLLGIMPGYFWLSRSALIETMLLFFTAVSLLFFLRWLKCKQDRLLVFSGLAMGLGFLTKYQMLVAVIIMVFSILFLARGQIKRAFAKFSIVVITAVLVVIPWAIITYQIYASKLFGEWLYALQVGNPERLLYSDRFPLPIYYLVEMTWPYSEIHPISIFLFIVGLAGLGFLAWRHNKEDKFTLVWFLSVYVFFSLIENKQWRYVLPLFPALAISAAVVIFFVYGRAHNSWKTQTNLNKKRLTQVAAGIFIALIAGAMVYSVNDAYHVVSKHDFEIKIEKATNYAIKNTKSNDSIMVLCPFNFFNQEMIKFYLWADGKNDIKTYQYPTMPVDTYTPHFNITEFIALCKQNNVKYVFTYEHGGTVPYYNTTLNLQQIYEQIYASGNFSKISTEATFGTNPRRILLLTFFG